MTIPIREIPVSKSIFRKVAEKVFGLKPKPETIEVDPKKTIRIINL